MRILLTADPELPVPPRHYGGIERIVDSLVRGLRGRGHAVALAAHPDSTAPADAFFPWPGRVSQRAGDTAANVRALAAAAASFRPDVLHSFSRLFYLAAVLPRRLPKVMSYQRRPSLRTTAWARRLSLGTLTFTGCSDHIARIGRAAGGTWTAIPNFVDVARYSFRRDVPADAPLVFLSRLEAIKGVHAAIDIAEASGRRLLIAGNRVDSPEGAAYWRHRVEPRLSPGRIDYVGPVDDAAKDELLGRAAAMVVPIEWDEPFGIVFAEALACGTPVITCPRGAAPEIVEPGRHGFLVESVRDGADAVRRLGEIDRGECRRRAEREFSADAALDRYEALYREVARTGAGPTERATPAREGGR